tara:strand:- start:32 stop:751 length:720 start_codon:yes stop_codon:yes gene_type:complete
MLATEASNVGALTEGPCEIQGRIESIDSPFTSPWTQQQCVYYEFLVEEKRRSGGSNARATWHSIINDVQKQSFKVTDPSGSVEINPRKAEFDLKSVAHERIGLLSGDASSELQTLLKDRDIETTNRISRELRCSEKVLTTGDTVYVFGEAKRVDEKLVICSPAPKYRKKGQTTREWRKECDKRQAEGMPLIVTDDGERKVEEGYSKSARGWMIATIILVVITLAFIVAGILKSIGFFRA